MRKLLLALAVALPAGAQEIPDSDMGRLYAACAPVQLHVVVSNYPERDVLLTERRVRTMAESRLALPGSTIPTIPRRVSRSSNGPCSWSCFRRPMRTTRCSGSGSPTRHRGLKRYCPRHGIVPPLAPTLATRASSCRV